jgi:hypothetical protein
VIAKLEKPQAIENLDAVIDTFDAFMVARGDLGVELPLEEVPGGPLRRQAIAVARAKAGELREQDVIGDHAYRVLIQELDWAELSAGGAVED